MSRPRYPACWSAWRVALAHDWLTGMRGGEKCLELLCDGFPRAPLQVLLWRRGAVSKTIEAHPIRTTFLQHIPGIVRHYRNWLPLFPLAVDSVPPMEADLLISLSHCAAKAFRIKRPGRHLCYCFTPMRYAWSFHDEYLGSPKTLKRRLAEPLLARMREWDRRVSDRVDCFVGISRHVCDRIRRFYGREAELVYPPVNIDFFTPAPDTPRQRFDLIVSALVPYKRIDLAVSAYSRTGFPLKIVGTGTEAARLRTMAAPNIEFLGWRSDEEILSLYRTCRLLVFPGEEDFGIVPLEAQACGTPVAAFARGGALETLEEGRTAVFFREQTEEALIDAVERCAAREWDTDQLRRNAERFSPQRYIDGLADVIDRLMASH